MVLKAVPPPIMTSEQLDEYVEAIRDVVGMAQTSPTFWTKALAMVGRAANINLKKKTPRYGVQQRPYGEYPKKSHGK